MTDLSVFLIFFSVIVQCFVARLGYNFIVGCYSQQTQCLVARRRRIIVSGLQPLRAVAGLGLGPVGIMNHSTLMD